MPEPKKLLTGIKNAGDLKIFLIDPVQVSEQYPVWNKYLGCHHWGKECDHVPEDEIWISRKAIPMKDDVINHEIVEREIMKDLETNKGFTREEAYEIGHYMSEGFERYEKFHDNSQLIAVAKKINYIFPDIRQFDLKQWLGNIELRGHILDDQTKMQLLSLIEN
jgi:hypothetical protein